MCKIVICDIFMIHVQKIRYFKKICTFVEMCDNSVPVWKYTCKVLICAFLKKTHLKMPCIMNIFLPVFIHIT